MAKRERAEKPQPAEEESIRPMTFREGVEYEYDRDREGSLFLRQKAHVVRDHYSIVDAEGDPVCDVRGNVSGRLLTVTLVENGRELFSLKKNGISLLADFTILKGGERIGSLKQRLKAGQVVLEGELNGKPLSAVGNLLARDFVILLGEEEVGALHKTVLMAGDWCELVLTRKEGMTAVIAAGVIIECALHRASG